MKTLHETQHEIKQAENMSKWQAVSQFKQLACMFSLS